MEQKQSFVKRVGAAVIFFLLPLVVFFWTSIGALTGFTIHMALLVLLVAFGMSFYKKADLLTLRTAIHGLLLLLIVGATGWFLSPFFFLLYLFPIYLGFLYTPWVAFSFLAALLIIFGSSSIGDVDVAFDTLTLLSLLLAIPLIIYLRKKYLILRQTKKDILILEDESGIKDADTIGRLLANRVTSLGVNVRQPLTFVKQASTLLLEDDLTPEEATQSLKRIQTTATETLEMIRQFETETSANRVLRNPKDIHEDHDLKRIMGENTGIKKPGKQ